MAALTPRILVGAVLLSLSLAGCGHRDDAAATSATSASTPATTSSSAAWSRPDSPPDPRTLLKAAAAALATVPDSTLVFIESETDDAGTWKARLAAGDGAAQQVKIGVDGVTVLVGPTPVNGGDAEQAGRRAALHAMKLDYRAAVDTVLATVPDGAITELTLAGGDAPVWNVDVWDTYLVEHHVIVNAVSGEVEANTQH